MPQQGWGQRLSFNIYRVVSDGNEASTARAEGKHAGFQPQHKHLSCSKPPRHSSVSPEPPQSPPGSPGAAKNLPPG